MQVHFGKRLVLLVSRNVEVLLFAFLSHFNTVATSLKLTAKGSDISPFRIEDEDRRMVRLIGPTFVNDVQASLTVDRDVVGRLPRESFGKLWPVMLNLKGMVIVADP